MIKCRTKELAIKGAQAINAAGIYCEFDGCYNIYAFTSEDNEAKGFAILTDKS